MKLCYITNKYISNDHRSLHCASIRNTINGTNEIIEFEWNFDTAIKKICHNDSEKYLYLVSEDSLYVLLNTNPGTHTWLIDETNHDKFVVLDSHTRQFLLNITNRLFNKETEILEDLIAYNEEFVVLIKDKKTQQTKLKKISINNKTIKDIDFVYSKDNDYVTKIKLFGKQESTNEIVFMCLSKHGYLYFCGAKHNITDAMGKFRFVNDNWYAVEYQDKLLEHKVHDFWCTNYQLLFFITDQKLPGFQVNIETKLKQDSNTGGSFRNLFENSEEGHSANLSRKSVCMENKSVGKKSEGKKSKCQSMELGDEQILTDKKNPEIDTDDCKGLSPSHGVFCWHAGSQKSNESHKFLQQLEEKKYTFDKFESINTYSCYKNSKEWFYIILKESAETPLGPFKQINSFEHPKFTYTKIHSNQYKEYKFSAWTDEEVQLEKKEFEKKRTEASDPSTILDPEYIQTSLL